MPSSGGRGALRWWWGIGVALVAMLAAAVPASAHVYWTSQGTDTIGRARANGDVAIRSFIPTAQPARGVAIDGQYVYWAQGSAQGSIGRARLNGTARDQSFITTGKNTRGVALDSFGIYWSHMVGGVGAIGRSSLDGSNANPMFIGTSGPPCGVAVDPDKLWWANSTNPGTVGRAHGPLDVEPDFIAAGGYPCGVAVTKHPHLLGQPPWRDDRAGEPRRHSRSPELHQRARCLWRRPQRLAHLLDQHGHELDRHGETGRNRRQSEPDQEPEQPVWDRGRSDRDCHAAQL